MQNVKALGETVLNRTRNVSVVVHCAGVMLRDKTLTDEGLEEVFAVQFLARYYLNKLLLPHLEATKGKVVVVSAGGSIRGIKFDFDNLQGEKFYNGVHALKHESLANDMQILEYSKRYPYILWFNYGPGVVKTTLLRDMGPLLQTIASLVSPCMSISPERAAEDIVELLTSQKESGLYGRGIKLNRPNAFRSDSVNQARLREVSDGLIEKALEHLQRKK
jgi:NAD(P)-dependent dehydrogenase (short-subunit alcohol dehydrogenase family)